MRWLNRLWTQDDGVSLILVALSMVVLIGFVGLVIDVGAIYQERRELSRGADAVVLAVAEDCALESRPCTDAQAAATGGEYADANADDGASIIEEIVLDLDEQTVFARTKTWDPETGTDAFQLLFMPVLGFDSTTVTAEAKAQWGAAIGGFTTPLIISMCEWEDYGGSVTEVTFTFHDGNNTEPCNSQAGQDLDGGFGWLETNGECTADVHRNQWADAEPGNSPPNGCSAAEFYNLLVENDFDVAIPIFDDLEGHGATGSYHVDFLAAFHVTGYNFAGQYKYPSGFQCPTAPGPGSPAKDASCLRGNFTTGIPLTDGEIGPPGTPYRGVYVVKLIG